jgi:hypothetical protein
MELNWYGPFFTVLRGDLPGGSLPRLPALALGIPLQFGSWQLTLSTR